jgi:hypothetical protein
MKIVTILFIGLIGLFLITRASKLETKQRLGSFLEEIA